MATVQGVNKERLDEVVTALKRAMSEPELRKLSQRAIQSRVWHLVPVVSQVMADLRRDEKIIKDQIFQLMSKLIYEFQSFALDTTLARAGILHDPRVTRGSSLANDGETKNNELDIICLDAKERMYMILEQYRWLPEFFDLYPIHFYENSFQFVTNIPKKSLNIRVCVYGLGIGGSMAISGLAKHGITTVSGHDKRSRESVTSRYQNASWRAYQVAERLLDDQAYQELIEYRQRINVTRDDGSQFIITSDRVQIILGHAIESSIQSAERNGAKIYFNSSALDNKKKEEQKGDEKYDIVAFFTGAHTAVLVPGILPDMPSWPEISSPCHMWLQLKESPHKETYCERGGEIGAEQWHYTIASARNSISDLDRIRNNIQRKLQAEEKTEQGEALQQYQSRLDRVQNIQETILNQGKRYDYIFTNAPVNEHNIQKQQAVQDHVVLNGGYTVETKIATSAVVQSGPLLDEFNTSLILCGGDACVPPNPLAAYGATLACEAADRFVDLVISHGHINSIIQNLNDDKQNWKDDLIHLKNLLVQFYDTKSRSENYFQFIQTLICNLYSLPPFYPAGDKIEE